MARYEDTVMGEEGRCQCGVRVDEGDNFGEDGEWLCGDCHADRVAAGHDDDFAEGPLSLSPRRTDWFRLARDITDSSHPALAGVDH